MLSPFEKIFHVRPSYTKLLVFGCLCYPWIKPYTHHKLEPCSKACIFIGYSLSQSAYHCLDPETDRIFVSRHVNFVESVLPYKTLNPNPPQPNTDTLTAWLPHSSPKIPIPVKHPHTSPNSIVREAIISSAPVISRATAAASQPSAAHIPPDITTDQLLPASSQPSTAQTPPKISSDQPDSATSLPSAPLLLHDISSDQPLSPTTSTSPQHAGHPMVTRSKNNIHKPLTKLSLTSVLSSSVQPEPTCASQALKTPEWRKAMSEEFDALIRNDLVLLQCPLCSGQGFPLDHNNRELLQFGRFRTNSGFDHSTDCAWDCVEWA
ncbi:hypothetical protein LWI29_014097 [Acer saccharum]|uniref:Retroviral polymerase SH3-like domain-containing protein n=1 Tax=Acer saccharum TaxID=4024 RepID=A0AA39W8H1_ACESA|nr:hypothetical protein LWI29_014097 [Acer saccharum]